jgi:hypothetical protein
VASGAVVLARIVIWFVIWRVLYVKDYFVNRA